MHKYSTSYTWIGSDHNRRVPQCAPRLSPDMKKPHLSDTSKHLEASTSYNSGQISVIPKPELRGFWGSSLIKPPFRVTSADVVIICPDNWSGSPDNDNVNDPNVIIFQESMSSFSKNPCHHFQESMYHFQESISQDVSACAVNVTTVAWAWPYVCWT